MPIITHICDSVKEYIENSKVLIRKIVAEGQIKCNVCMEPLEIHSTYVRGVKETGDRIEIVILRCKSGCEKGKALLPDFISPYKHYSIYEIEKVVSRAQTTKVSNIVTDVSESTIYRWINQIGERATAAISIVKAMFVCMGAAVSELSLDERGRFAELESLLDKAPKCVRHSGTTLGLANLWLGTRSPPAYI